MSNEERPTRQEARAEWDNVVANQFYSDVRGYQWEPDAHGYWECSENGEFISPEKMRLKVWEELCGIPAGVPAKGRKKFYVEWDEDEPTVRVWDEYIDAEPLSFAEAKKEVVEHLQHQVEWYRAQIRTVRELKVKDVEE